MVEVVMSAKYGTVLNICVPPLDYPGVITDANGLVVCDVINWAKFFTGQDGEFIDLQIDMETGAILNWKNLNRNEIVELIEKANP
jgi:hypothetical protein